MYILLINNNIYKQSNYQSITVFSLVTKRFCFFAAQPNNTSITFIPDPATVGNQVEIRCDSEGVPEPSFIIMRNGKNVSTEKTYTISLVKQSDEGPYACIAVNILGNDSATDNLTVIGEIKFLDAFPFFLAHAITR